MSLLGAALVLMAAQAAPPPPSISVTVLEKPNAEKMELGRSIARRNPQWEFWNFYYDSVTQIFNDHPELSPTDKEQLRTIVLREAEAFRSQAIEAEAYAYAERLSVEDLRAINAFKETPAGAAKRRAMTFISDATTDYFRKGDFSKSVRTAFCAETGKLCE